MALENSTPFKASLQCLPAILLIVFIEALNVAADIVPPTPPEIKELSCIISIVERVLSQSSGFIVPFSSPTGFFWYVELHDPSSNI